MEKIIAVFISGFFPSKIEEKLLQNSVTNIQNAANTLQKAIYKGLEYYFPDFVTFNFPFVGAFPLRYRKIIVPKCNIGNNGISYSFFNLLYFKHFFIYLQLRRALKKLIKVNRSNEIVLLIYSLNYQYLKAAIKIAQQQSNVTVGLIVPDLIEFIGGPKGLLYNIYKRATQKKINILVEKVDFYILLSEYMLEKLPVGNKPYCIIEGIYNDQIDSSFKLEKNKKNKTLLYSGSLAKRFGIVEMISAFTATSDSNFRLVICGSGECEVDVINASRKDPRIEFLGIIHRNKVLELQRCADLLINPRQPDSEYTKYSFPSKIIEYFASGTPTLMFPLPGIPIEYYQYCYLFSDNNIDNMSMEISKLLALDTIILREKGLLAQKFIVEQKNPISQLSKLNELINNMFHNN